MNAAEMPGYFRTVATAIEARRQEEMVKAVKSFGKTGMKTLWPRSKIFRLRP